MTGASGAVADMQVDAMPVAAWLRDRRTVAYWLGNAVWLTFSQASSSTFPFATAQGGATVLGIVQALCFSLGFFVLALLSGASRGLFGRYTLVKAAAGLCGFSLVTAIAGEAFAPWLLWPATVTLAVGRACGFCQWIRLLQPFGLYRAKWLLILGSIAHIAMLCALDMLVPQEWLSPCVFGLCAPIGLAALAWNAWAYGGGEPVLPSAASVSTSTSGGSAARRTWQFSLPALPRQMALPVVCAMALTLITPIASSVFVAGSESLYGGVVKPLSHTACLVLLAVAWFVFEQDVTLPQLYCVSLPLFASVFFAAPLGGDVMGWVVLFIGNGCFFFVSLLMVTTCLTLSQRHGVGVVAVYGVFAGCMYLTDMVQLLVRYLTSADGLVVEQYVATLLLLYVVIIPVFFIVAPLVRRRGFAEGHGADADGGGRGNVADASGVRGEDAASSGGMERGEKVEHLAVISMLDLSEACAVVAQRAGLSKRQAEVMEGLVRGRDVEHISEALGLAPNTVRSYRKSLYAALDVHGLQELIDLVERAVETPEAQAYHSGE